MPMLSGTVRAVDVVGDDQERRVDLRVEVDDQLVEVGGAHRVEPGVRLVEQDDLGIEHERAGQPDALAHTAGDLAGQLALGALSPTISIFSRTMYRISVSDFLVCSRSGNAMLSNRFIEPNSAPSWNSTPKSFRIS